MLPEIGVHPFVHGFSMTQNIQLLVVPPFMEASIWNDDEWD